MHGVGNGAFGNFAHFLPELSPYQRTVFGFPAVDVDRPHLPTVFRVAIVSYINSIVINVRIN